MKYLLTLALLAILQMGWAQSEYCLDGTVWDAALGGCIPEVDQCDLPYDFNDDGIVGLGDLLTFLTGFGATLEDSDQDGVCDEIDDCVGSLDECGVCNGPGAIYNCGCEDCIAFVECGDPVGYQGYDYATVLIGDQCWFAENLQSENYKNGDAIPAGLSNTNWQTTTSGAVAIYGEVSSTCTENSPDGDACDEAWSLNEYGRLYNWYAVDDARGLCPSGWHIPTDAEWTVMTDFLGGESVAGGQMKTTNGWHNDGNGTDSSGFSGLPGGYRYGSIGDFGSAGLYGYWWGSSPYLSSAWGRRLSYPGETVWRDVYSLRSGFSVRCIREAE